MIIFGTRSLPVSYPVGHVNIRENNSIDNGSHFLLQVVALPGRDAYQLAFELDQIPGTANW